VVWFPVEVVLTDRRYKRKDNTVDKAPESLQDLKSARLGPRGRPRRVNLNCTVHPDTMGRLDELCSRFVTSRGMIIDRLTAVLHQAYASGKMVCIHGQLCQIGRTDLPEVY